MQLCEHDLDGWHFFAIVQRHFVDRNAAAVIGDGDGVVVVNGDFDFACIAGESLVDGIIHDLINEVMKAHLARRTDIHGGTQAHGFKSFEDFNVVAGVTTIRFAVGGRGGLVEGQCCRRFKLF